MLFGIIGMNCADWTFGNMKYKLSCWTKSRYVSGRSWSIYSWFGVLWHE